MRVLAGLDLGGATLTERDHLPVAHGAIGEVSWGPAQLLRDLELRLGFSAPDEANAVRVARYATRMAKLAPQGRYYSRSFQVDALGTAASVLQLRDLLVEAGWTGQALADGGARLDTVHQLEQLGEPMLPAGEADRVAAVAVELARRSVRPYTELALVEPRTSWSTCWQTVFRAIESGGTQLKVADPVVPSAPASTDLGRLQRSLGRDAALHPIDLQGDGSLVVITAETSWHAAHVVAAVLACLPAENTVVIREDGASALDSVLTATGARSQGLHSVSPWRSAQQVLPLALELAFEPKDPYRVLELLTLPIGPFNGFVGHSLARALSQSPGIGSPAWEAVKQQLPNREATSERAAEQLARIAEWLEAPAVEARASAPIAILLSVVERVRSWLISRIQTSSRDASLLAAAQQAAALHAALESDPRPSLTLVQVRKLAEAILSSGTATELRRERAGRPALADSPGKLRRSCESVVWWSFTAARSGAGRLPWRRSELAALTAANLRFPEPGRRFMEQAAAARAAFCCATRRLMLVMPREHAGQPLPHHPLWDELLAGARLDEVAMARVTLSALELCDPASTRLLRRRPPLVPRQPLDLPGGHSEWRVPPEQVAPIECFSPSSLEALLGCPFEWALRYRAGARTGGHALPPLFLLNGSLGHRLVEMLHAAGAFALEEDALRIRAKSQLEVLFVQEGAVLLRPGMGFERAQLEQQLVSSVVELSRLMRGAKLRLVAVEKAVAVSWQGGTLEGRIDLLVATENGEHAIIDMKSGMSAYRALLRTGHALQLAAYGFAVASEHGAVAGPEAAYFSLKHGKLFGLASRSLPHAEVIAGPGLAETWQRVERSMQRALPLAQQGRFAATGVRGAAPLLETLGVVEADEAGHFALPAGARCHYCRYDALCGRRWEALQ